MCFDSEFDLVLGVQAIGNGMIGGLLIDQRLTSGFRHVAVMAFAAWIVFRWLLAF